MYSGLYIHSATFYSTTFIPRFTPPYIPQYAPLTHHDSCAVRIPVYILLAHIVLAQGTWYYYRYLILLYNILENCWLLLGLSIENFLQQWEVPSITGCTFDAADRIFAVGRISRGTGGAFLHILQKDGIPLQYSAAKDFVIMVKILKEKKRMHRREVLKSAVLVVLSFGGSQLAGWVDNIAAKATEVGKSVRVNDPGKMVPQGYTAGNISKPVFDWVKNLQAKYSDSDKKEHYQQVSAAFAIFSNLMREKLPKSIISDFEEFLTATGIPRMHYPDTPPIFSVALDGFTHTFSQQPLAPPSGQTTTNYVRYIHREINATKYLSFWITGRNGNVEEKESGGNFYFSQYGICVKQATDTCGVFRPKDYPGTSLMPKNTNIIQTVMGFGISKRLASIWKRYKEEQLSVQESLDMISDGSENDED
ncbi:hypothetical protein BDZ91DRAFT_782503 [Kalaharituber pfeilii]|nr:hypothetical protein BDZ91DRAFT_782503 [Kalaharituber pfeilii]